MPGMVPFFFLVQSVVPQWYRCDLPFSNLNGSFGGSCLHKEFIPSLHLPGDCGSACTLVFGGISEKSLVLNQRKAL